MRRTAPSLSRTSQLLAALLLALLLPAASACDSDDAGPDEPEVGTACTAEDQGRYRCPGIQSSTDPNAVLECVADDADPPAHTWQLVDECRGGYYCRTEQDGFIYRCEAGNDMPVSGAS